jgi:signal transduction histidine kinase/DNA-binding NarL/FixJ family response regulator
MLRSRPFPESHTASVIASAGSVSTGAAPSLRVLLVEDNPADADLVREALGDAAPGALLVCVERISEALGRAREAQWDVVLLDLSLPDAHDLSGLEQLLRSFPDLAIVVLTSLEDDRVAMRAVAEGAQDYLLKSQLQPALLVRSIRYAVERRRHAERARALADARAARIAAETESRTRLLRACPNDSLRVLLVEDNPADADLVRNALAEGRAGATLVCVERISKALERAREEEWDVVLLDLSLPDAQELAGAHRLRVAFPRLPIIVLTSLEDDRVAAGAVAEGAQDYLLKGQIEPHLLVRSIRYAIERQHYAERARLLAEERAARVAAEAAQRRALLLSEVSGALFGSLDDEAALRTVARVLVRELADWCAIEVGEDAATPRLTASAHVDQTKEAQLRRWWAPSGAGAPVSLASAVVRTGRSELHSEIPDPALGAWARDAAELQLLREVGLRSAMIVPVSIRGRVYGAMTLAAVGFRRYGPEDLALADEIARRLATALDNSRLHRETQRAVRAREDVLAVVSHDLRSPLQTISLAAYAAVRGVEQCGAECTLRRPLETIQRAARSANVLLQDLLDMAAIRAGRLAIRIATEDAGALIAEAVQAHEALALAKGLSLASRGAAAAAAVLCDRERVQQILSNVLANAVRECASGARIELSLHADERFATFTVADSGPGIPQEALPLVFEAYWSSAKRRGRGTGLGLFISKGIVEAHGGRMWIESRLGEGTSVRFTIPLADGARQDGSGTSGA